MADGFSEYEGYGVMPNTVFPKGPNDLTNGDKLRLASITGQEIDSRAPIDPAFWNGASMPDPEVERRERQAATKRERLIRKQVKDRYRETKS
jgi:hypothetical protein